MYSNAPHRRSTPERLHQQQILRFRYLLWGVLTLLITLLFHPAVASEPGSTARTVTVGIVANNEPYSSLQGQVPTGFSIDVLNRISEESGLNFQYRFGSWSNIYAAFLRGDLDVIDEISWREDRAKSILFTDPYHIRQTAVMHHSDRPLPGIKSAGDLKGYRVGVLRDIYYREFLIEQGIDVIEYDLQSDLVQALSFGWVDAIVGAEVTLSYLAKQEGFLQLSKNAVIPLNGMESEDFRLGVLKDQPRLYQTLQEAMRAIPQSWLTELSERWMEYGGQPPIRNAGPALTAEQKNYLQRLPPLRVGLMRDYAPFSFSENGRMQGLSVDILYRLQDVTGIEFIPVSDQWSNLFSLFKAGELDLIANISDLPERRAFTLFTQPYHRIPNVAYTRDKHLRLNKPSDLTGLRIGLGHEVFYEDAVRTLFPGQVTSYTEQSAMFKALAENQIDVVLAALPNGNHLIRELGLTDIWIAGELQLPGLAGEDLRLGLQPELAPLRDILDQALSQLSRTEKRTIENRWLGARPTSAAPDTISLTRVERDLLQAKNNTLTYCVHPDRFPLEQLTWQGQHEGVSASLLATLQQKVDNLKFRLYPTESWQASLNAIRNGQCDLIPMIMPNSLWQHDLMFSQPWYNAPNVVLGPLDAPFISRISELEQQPVGITADNPLKSLLLRRYPELNLQPAPDTLTGIQRLRHGRLYGFIGPLATTSHLLQQESMGDVRVLGRLPLDSNYAVAVQRQQPELLGLMEKLLQNLKPSELKQIESDWLTLRLTQETDYRRLWQIAGAFGVVLVALFFWNRKLGRLNQQLQTANAQLAHLSITDQLTELGNRNSLNQIFSRYAARCHRDNKTMGLTLLDVDFFKKINDTFGHQAGDLCLQHLAEQMRQVFCEPQDHLIRFGGEEFIILSSASSADRLADRLEALREQVAATPLHHQQQEITMTASLGSLIQIPSAITAMDDWLKAADQALYTAKHRGRNRLIRAEPLNR